LSRRSTCGPMIVTNECAAEDATEGVNLTSDRLSMLGSLQVCCYRAIRKVKRRPSVHHGSVPRPLEPISEKLLKGHGIKTNVRCVPGGSPLVFRHVADFLDTVCQSKMPGLTLLRHMTSYLFQATQDAKRSSSSSIVPGVSSSRP